MPEDFNCTCECETDCICTDENCCKEECEEEECLCECDEEEDDEEVVYCGDGCCSEDG